MLTVIECFSDQTPLHRHIRDIARQRQRLINGPGRRTVIDDHIRCAGSQRDAIVFLSGQITKATAQVTHHDVMRRNYESEVAQANAIARRSLAGDRDVWVSDYQLLHQGNQTRHAKNYEARSFLFTSDAKASWA